MEAEVIVPTRTAQLATDATLAVVLAKHRGRSYTAPQLTIADETDPSEIAAHM